MYEKYFKRILDFVMAFLLLIITLPVLLIVSVAIKVEDPEGPVLFKQNRAGKNGVSFTLYKFRTMKVDRKKHGKDLSDKERLTKIGGFLRKASIDELPQLINIIRGEMSFIGPRPLLLKYLPFYTDEEFKRHNVLPGISGWAQVNGRNALNWDERFEHDIEYVNNISLGMDLNILYLTIHKVFRRTNVEVDALPDLDVERVAREI